MHLKRRVQPANEFVEDDLGAMVCAAGQNEIEVHKTVAVEAFEKFVARAVPELKAPHKVSGAGQPKLPFNITFVGRLFQPASFVW